jgi:hypothetical protein
MCLTSRSGCKQQVLINLLASFSYKYLKIKESKRGIGWSSTGKTLHMWKLNFSRFKVLTAVLLKIQVFWDVVVC